MELPFRGGGEISGRDEPELERCGGAGACDILGEGFGPFFLDILPTSTDCERFKGSCLMDGSFLAAGSFVVPNPQCWANSERLSSMGVKILLDLAGALFSTGIGC
jgi:hypothetical protein